jgi:hypothetical protein
MKPDPLDLPPEIELHVAGAREWSGPSPDEKDRLRGRLQWAFVASRMPHLREVPVAARRPVGAQHWWTVAARAAAALVLAHVPVALATLGIVVAAVPVTRSWLTRTENRPPVSPPIVRPPRVGGPAPKAGPPAAEAQPSGSPSWVALPLAPPPAPFLAPPEAPRVEPSALPVGPALAPQHPPEAYATRTPDKGATLATERELLELARRALLRDDPTAALVDLEQHRRHYPDSQLSEEREALSIQALLRTGRSGEARLRDGEFRRRFPSSLLLPALDAALRE